MTPARKPQDPLGHVSTVIKKCLVTVVNVAGQLFLRAGPCPTSSLFMLRRREDKGGPVEPLFPTAKPHDWLERGSRGGKRK